MTRGESYDGWYMGRRVLVIGGFGFLGVNACRRLLAAGADVTILTPRVERHDVDVPTLEAGGAHIVEGDLRDPVVVNRVAPGQDVVLNLSGRSGAARSMTDPLTDLDVNCRGNLVLLDAMRSVCPAAKLVFPGSRLEYGRPVTLPVSEVAALDPWCVHAVHKIAIEHYLTVYQRVYGIRSTVLRLTNPYGPGQPAGRTAYGIVNHMIQVALDDGPLVIYGDGGQLRDYIYVDDAIDAVLAVGAESATDGRTYNVGSGVGTSFVDMARAVVEIVGRGRVVFQPWPALDEQIETGDFVADSSRLTQETGWRPRTSFGEGLRRTVEAYRAHVSARA